MLRSTVTVYRQQWTHVKGRKPLERAYREGLPYWQQRYGEEVLGSARTDFANGQWYQVFGAARALVQYSPAFIARRIARKILKIFGARR